MRPGFIAAMCSETRTLAKHPRPGEIGRLKNGGLLVLSGMGRDRAAAAARRLIGEGATVLISWGAAAGLIQTIRPGTLILPDIVISRDREVFATDAALYERIRDLLGGCMDHLRAALAESARVLKSDREKADLFQETGALAADMESAAIAETASAAGIPFFVVRVVLDSRRNAMPLCALSSIDEYGKVRLSRFVRNLAGRPWEVPDLITLALNQRKARATLKRIGKKVSSFERF